MDNDSHKHPDPDKGREHVRHARPVSCLHCQTREPATEEASDGGVVAGALQQILSPSTCSPCRTAGWEIITNHYFWRLRSYATKVLRCANNAEDIAQDCLLRAWARIQTFRGHTPEEFSGWLMAICLNRTRDYGRSTEREQRLIDPKSLHVYVDAAEAASEADYHRLPTSLSDSGFVDQFLDQINRNLRIRNAISKLSQRQRHCLVRFYQGFSYKEIAIELGISSGAVGRYIKEAREQLAQLLSTVKDTL